MQNGVFFDLSGSGRPVLFAWTVAPAKNAWLALDRNGNGAIDNGKELFGNYTAQPTPPKGQMKNGFLALAVFDQPENGGNGDGVIDGLDAIFPKLLAWQDDNHNGVSEPDELHDLPSVGVTRIDLHYKTVNFQDQYGNQFHWQSKIYRAKGTDDGRRAWDVALTYDLKAHQPESR